MRIVSIILFSLVSFAVSFSQIINSSFIAPDTVCVNQTFTIQNTSTGSISSQYWNFCNPASAIVFSTNLGASATSNPVFISINDDGGNYYGYVSNNGNGTLTRFSFGNNLTNAPTNVNLGNFGGQMPINGEGIAIEKEGSNWYGVVVGGATASIARMSFGTSLANTPTMVNMGNIGGMAYPHRLKIIHAGGNKYGFTVSRNNNTITRFDFGNSLNNVPVGTNLGNIGGLSGPNDFDIVYVNGNWYMFITNDGNNTLARLNFGNSLLNTPTGTNLGTIGVSPLRGISIDVYCGSISGQVTSQFNNFYNLNFPSGPTGMPTTGLVGSGTFSFPHSIEKYRIGDQIHAFVCNANSASLSRVTYTNCGQFIPNTTAVNPSPISFPVPGIYTISILNNSNLYNQSIACKTIAVLNSLIATASPTNVCAGSSSTLNVFGTGSFTWNPGSAVNNSVVVTPTASTIYTVTTNSSLTCGNSQTVSVNVVATPTVNLNASSFTICAGSNSTLTASGATNYTWIPGNFTGTNVVLSPTVTTIYTVTGLSSGCSDTKTIQIVVNPSPTVSAAPNPAVICLNNTITVTASGANNYTWSPNVALSSTNSPIAQGSPSSTTVYSVLGSLGTCTNLTTFTIVVLPLPTVVATPSLQTMCSNTNAVLSASGAGTYTWNPGNFVGSSFTVAPSSNTTYTVIGTAGTCTGSATSTVNVGVSPTITANTSSSQICSGNTITLSSSGANTYTWNPGPIIGGTVTTSPNSTTNYSVIGTSTNGCIGTAVVNVSVTPTPTLNIVPSSPSVCSGYSVSLTGSGASSYTWLPGPVSGSVLIDNPISIAQYTLYGSNGTCSSSATATLLVVQNPTVNAVASPSMMCIGRTSTLAAAGANTYSWAPNFSLSSSGGGTVFSTTTVSACYTVTGYNSFGCSSTASVCITVTPTSQTFTVAATPTSVCSGNSSTLQALGAQNYTFYTPFTQTSSIIVSPTTTTIYTVQAQFNNGCVSTQTTLLNTQPTPTVNILSLPGVMCIGEQGSLEGSGATTYTWIPSASNNTNIIVTPTTTTTYTLFGQTGACIGSSVVTVTVNPIPTLSAQVVSPTLCLGKNTDMFVSGASSFTWEPGSIFGFSTNVSPTINTTYTVTGNSLNCFSSQTVDVMVVQNPALNIIANPTLTCLDPLQTATLTAGGANTFTWLPNSTSSQSLAISPSVALQYTVSGTNSNGCVSSATIGLNVDPDLHSDISDTSICSGSTVNLLASGAISYNWLPGNFSQSTVNTIPEASTVYTITGTSGLCSKSGTVYVEVITNPIHEIPEVFTPNDDGKNDYFVIRSDAQVKIDIKVFNRWGALVYSHAEYDNSWDGTAKGDMVLGKNKLPAGTYYYVIDMESCDKQVVRGYVVIQY